MARVPLIEAGHVTPRGAKSQQSRELLKRRMLRALGTPWRSHTSSRPFLSALRQRGARAALSALGDFESMCMESVGHFFRK
jgi:hypothetical protein